MIVKFNTIGFECGCLFVCLVILCFSVVMNYHPRHFVFIVMLASSLNSMET